MRSHHDPRGATAPRREIAHVPPATGQPQVYAGPVAAELMPADEVRSSAGSFSFGEMIQMAEYLAASGLIKGVETPAQAFGLMMFAQSQGLHPGVVVSRYHLMDGAPSMKSDVMLAEFQADGGRVEWVRSDDETVEAVFTHAAYHPKPFRVSLSLTKLVESEIAMTWNKQGKFVLKKNYRSSPAAMLRARAVTAGIRAVHPGVQHGIYAPEELDTLTERAAEGVDPPQGSVPALPAAPTSTARPKPTPVVDAVRVRTQPEDVQTDRRSYVELVEHEAQVLTADVREHTPDAKEITKHQLHRHLLKAAIEAGHHPAFPPDTKVPNARVVEIGQDLYRDHRDWVRGEVSRYVDGIYEASKPKDAPEAPTAREPGDEG